VIHKTHMQYFCNNVVKCVTIISQSHYKQYDSTIGIGTILSTVTLCLTIHPTANVWTSV